MLRPTVLALILLPLAICEKWPQLFDPQIQQNVSSAPLSGRQLIRSWLGQRQLVCNNPATEGLCPDGSGCCLLTQSCCANAYCADPGDVCCPTGTCGPNKGCCGELHCYPLGGECCADESYCDPGNHCYIYDGYQTCCTDSHCTARVTAGVTSTFYVAPTVPPAPTITAPAPTITEPPPVVTTSVVEYTYYYFTITWYYYSYYWIFTTFDEINTPTTTVTTTSTYITTSSVTSVYETDSDAASASFTSISLDFSSPTPVAATSLPPPPTVPAPTTTSTPSQTSTSSKSSKSETVVVTVTAPSSSATAVQSAASIRDLQTTGAWAVAVFFSFGVLLVWL